jgi:hypothetical protein
LIILIILGESCIHVTILFKRMEQTKHGLIH